jgi:hypothetical protein
VDPFLKQARYGPGTAPTRRFQSKRPRRALSSALNLAKGQRSEFPVAVLAHTCQCVLREGGVGRLLIAIIEIGAAPFGLKTTSSLEGTRWLVGSAGSASTA